MRDKQPLKSFGKALVFGTLHHFLIMFLGMVFLFGVLFIFGTLANIDVVQRLQEINEIRVEYLINNELPIIKALLSNGMLIFWFICVNTPLLAQNIYLKYCKYNGIKLI